MHTSSDFLLFLPYQPDRQFTEAFGKLEARACVELVTIVARTRHWQTLMKSHQVSGLPVDTVAQIGTISDLLHQRNLMRYTEEQRVYSASSTVCVQGLRVDAKVIEYRGLLLNAKRQYQRSRRQLLEVQQPHQADRSRRLRTLRIAQASAASDSSFRPSLPQQLALQQQDLRGRIRLLLQREHENSSKCVPPPVPFTAIHEFHFVMCNRQGATQQQISSWTTQSVVPEGADFGK